MKYLQADNYKKVNIALKTAPSLIRQKASFGTELSDQAHDLARILVGLQDTYEMEQFQEMRQSGLIALIASAPEIVAPYLIDIYFIGDISIQQRCIVLSALGVGARELAGLERTVYPNFIAQLTLGIDISTIVTGSVASTVHYSYGPPFTTA